MYHIIYSNKDSYIYEVDLNDEYNFGADKNLVLKKDFDGSKGLNGVSRLLLQFDLTETSKSIVNGDITNPQFYLRLYEQKSSELSPEYDLKAYPLSSSWKEGTGYTEQNPNSRNGVSWVKRNETFNNMSWSLVSDTNADSGSRSVVGGGVWITGSGYEASQSFSYQSPDINMNVTDMVNKWLGGSNQITNNGLIVKWSTLHENSISKSGDINYFSKEGHTVYSPQLEVRWDSHTPCTGSNTGSLRSLNIDGTKDNYLYMINLKDKYKDTEIPKFRVGGRKRYQSKSTSFEKSTTSTLFIPEKSGSYSITDVITGKTIVPFGEHSYLSCDSTSNYFNQRLDGFITNRKYRVILKLQTNDNKELIFDENFEFKVVK